MIQNVYILFVFSDSNPIYYSVPSTSQPTEDVSILLNKKQRPIIVDWNVSPSFSFSFLFLSFFFLTISWSIFQLTCTPWNIFPAVMEKYVFSIQIVFTCSLLSFCFALSLFLFCFILLEISFLLRFVFLF